MNVTNIFLILICTLQLILGSVGNTDVGYAPISGRLPESCSDHSSSLSVVVYSRSGIHIETAAVLSNYTFTFHDLPNHIGKHILHVVGAVSEDYHPILVTINKHSVATFEHRENDLHLAQTDEDETIMKSTPLYLQFVLRESTNYTRKKRPWRLKDLWAYKLRFLQVAAVAFVVWFPQFIRSLPEEIRAEIMGEKSDDKVDPTFLVRALAGMTDTGENEVSASSSKQ